MDWNVVPSDRQNALCIGTGPLLPAATSPARIFGDLSIVGHPSPSTRIPPPPKLECASPSIVVLLETCTHIGYKCSHNEYSGSGASFIRSNSRSGTYVALRSCRRIRLYASNRARNRCSVGAVQRELESLSRVGLIVRKSVGSQVFYQANRQAPIFPEMSALINKTIGIFGVLCSALYPHSQSKWLPHLFTDHLRAKRKRLRATSISGSSVFLCAFLSHSGVVWKLRCSFVVGQSTRQES